MSALLNPPQCQQILASIPPDILDQPLLERVSYATRFLSAVGFSSAIELFDSQLTVIDTDPRANKPRSGFVKGLRALFRDGKVTEIIATCHQHRFMQEKGTRERQVHATADVGYDMAERVVVNRLTSELLDLAPMLKKGLKTYTVRDIQTWNFEKLEALFEAHSPLLYNFLWTLFTSGTDKYGATKRNRKIIVNVALSLLCYARNQQCNLLQGHLGFYLYSSHVGKRQLTTFNQMGLCVSPSSIIELAGRLGRDSEAALKLLIKTRRIVLCMDNADYTADVKVDLPGKTKHIQHDTVGYAFCPDPGAGVEEETAGGGRGLRQRFVSRSELQHSRAAFVTNLDLYPSKDASYYVSTAKVNIFAVLKRFHDPAMSSFIDRKGISEPMAVAIDVLPLTRTAIYNLPALPLNEGKTDECMQIIDQYLQNMGIPPEGMTESIMLLKGDLKTKAMVDGGIFQRQDTRDPKQKFDFVETGMGLFHLHFAIRRLVNTTYWGKATDPFSIQRFLKVTGNNSVKRDGKDFRATLLFQNDMLDACILAAVYTAVGAKHDTQFGLFLKQGHGWKQSHVLPLEHAITVLSQKCFDFTGMRNRQEHEKRDVVLEAALLFMRDMLVIREFEAAVRAGDTGRIVCCIEYWCVIVQASKQKNYALALVEIVANLHVVWGDDYKQHFQNSMLVNPSGREGKWMPDDLYCEWIVREVKALIRPFMNALNPFSRDTLARQISLMQSCRLQWTEITGAVNYGQKAALAKSKAQVMVIMRKLMESAVFTKVDGRLVPAEDGGEPYSIPRDLYGVGLSVLGSGVPLRKYKERARYNWENVVYGGLEGEDLDMLGNGGDDEEDNGEDDAETRDDEEEFEEEDDDLLGDGFRGEGGEEDGQRDEDAEFDDIDYLINEA
ncbi:hypothetical protein BJ508DRAFT_320234 [Ascobolus immersus RN42]|uniref:DUF6589 domain-containing protein n=1 Tax=Ascobolus immersus RN42 TaxID=1160509 RepID=A0A3N4IV78_ASCIM|nr:hypothetical protein BJ508DRAFT_320234 [Ascobolus immersus RN42]